MIDLSDLSQLELEELKKDVDKLLSFKTLKGLGEYESLFKLRDKECPYCKSKNIVKNGHTKYGVQKMVCKDCHLNFNGKTGTVLAHSRHSLNDHLIFLKMELWSLPLKAIANELSISLTSAFYWRHRLYEAIKDYNKSQSSLKGEIELDSTYIKLSFKGHKKDILKIPDNRGINDSLVCVNTSMDEYDHIKIRMAHLNRETIGDYKDILKGNDDIHHITSDGFLGIESLAKELNIPISIVKSESYKSDDGYDLSEINEFHNEIKKMIKKTNGVSIRHLDGYLNMVIFRKHMTYRYKESERLYRSYERSYISNINITNFEIYKKAIPIDLSPLYKYQ